MKKDYAEKERFVLEKVFEMCQKSPTKHIHYSDLDNLDFDCADLTTMIDELHNKEYLDSQIDEHFKISPRGIEFLQDKRNVMGNNSTNHIINNINAPVGNLQQLTSHSSQSFSQSQTNNSDFNSAIESIIELVKTSSLSNFVKEDFITDIERIQNLAKQEPSQELVEHAKSKINYLETAIKVTDLALKVAPFFPNIYAFFDGLQIAT